MSCLRYRTSVRLNSMGWHPIERISRRSSILFFRRANPSGKGLSCKRARASSCVTTSDAMSLGVDGDLGGGDLYPKSHHIILQHLNRCSWLNPLETLLYVYKSVRVRVCRYEYVQPCRSREVRYPIPVTYFKDKPFRFCTCLIDRRFHLQAACCVVDFTLRLWRSSAVRPRAPSEQ